MIQQANINAVMIYKSILLHLVSLSCNLFANVYCKIILKAAPVNIFILTMTKFNVERVACSKKKTYKELSPKSTVSLSSTESSASFRKLFWVNELLLYCSGLL